MISQLVFLVMVMVVRISALIEIDELDAEIQSLIANRHYTVRCEFEFDGAGNDSHSYNASIRVGDCQQGNENDSYELASQWRSRSALVARVSPSELKDHRYLMLTCCSSSSVPVESESDEALFVVCSELEQVKVEQQQTSDQSIRVEVQPTVEEQQKALSCHFSEVTRTVGVTTYSHDGSLLETVPCLGDSANASALFVHVMSSRVSRVMLNATDVHFEVFPFSARLEVQRSTLIVPLNVTKKAASNSEDNSIFCFFSSNGYESVDYHPNKPSGFLLRTLLIAISLGALLLLLAVGVLATMWWCKQRRFKNKGSKKSSSSSQRILKIENGEDDSIP